MNRTIEDSQNFDIVCISFGKEKEKGIEVKSKGQKDSFLTDTMEISATNCNAQDMKFSREQIETLKANRETRKTEKSIKRLNAMGR